MREERKERGKRGERGREGERERASERERERGERREWVEKREEERRTSIKEGVKEEGWERGTGEWEIAMKASRPMKHRLRHREDASPSYRW